MTIEEIRETNDSLNRAVFEAWEDASRKEREILSAYASHDCHLSEDDGCVSCEDYNTLKERKKRSLVLRGISAVAYETN